MAVLVFLLVVTHFAIFVIGCFCGEAIAESNNRQRIENLLKKWGI